ncbi:MAG: wax ester/triacylglycerol synthase family O-acyltransferase [Rudaea sp.]
MRTKSESRKASPRREAREPMSKVDTAWLRMECPTNLMMITGVMIFSRRVSYARLKRVLTQRFLAFRRFRQKAVDTGSAAYWVNDDAFSMDRHLRKISLPPGADKVALEKVVSDLASTPLDSAHPRWQFSLLNKYQGGSVVVVRIHHCYADGLALVQVMLSLTDAAPEPSKRAKLADVWLPHEPGGVFQRLLDPARAGMAKVATLGAKVLDKGLQIVREPGLAASYAREGGEIARELVVALSLADDPPTSFKGPLSAHKRCAWARPLPLPEVKAISKILRCTVNDVLLACAAGALRSYLAAIGESVDGTTIRATVPVNLRPHEHAVKLGNHFGLVFLDLPIGEANPLRRLERVAESMRELKQSKQAALTFGLLAAVGMAPAALQRMALELFSRKATTVATNVPGPQMPLYLAGHEVREMMFWVPQNGSIGMGLSILSYNGNVHFGLIADGQRVADPDAIVQRFAREVEKLTLITLMEDWDAEIVAADAEATLTRFARNRR